MSRLIHVAPRAPLNERSELLAELTHVGGQLHACSKPEAAQPFIDELAEIAQELAVPISERRADAVIFLAHPEKIGTATWAQCGGLLYALCQECPDNCLQIGSRVAQRLAQLAPRSS